MATPAFDQVCFLISPIGDEGSDIRHRADGVREFIVSPAVAELGLMAVRADDIAQPGQITSQVIEHVLEAKGAVADLTGANANVFYELAIRHTVRLPVVLIAHEGDRGRLPFDLAQMRTIFYDHRDLKSAAACKAEITKQLREALEKDVVDSPVAAGINLANLQGGNASEQGLARMIDQIELMATEQSHLIGLVNSVGNRLEVFMRPTPPQKLNMEALTAGLARAEADRQELVDRIKEHVPDADVTIDTRQKRVVVVTAEDTQPSVVSDIAAIAVDRGLAMVMSKAIGVSSTEGMVEDEQ